MFGHDDSKSTGKLEYKASFEDFRQLALELLLDGERYMESDSFLQELADNLTTDASVKRTIRATLGLILKAHAQAKDLHDEGVMGPSDFVRCLQRRSEHEFRDVVVRSCYQAIAGMQTNPQFITLLQQLDQSQILTVERLNLLMQHHRDLSPISVILDALLQDRSAMRYRTFHVSGPREYLPIDERYSDACAEAFDRAVVAIGQTSKMRSIALLAGTKTRPGQGSPVLAVSSRSLYDRNVFRLMFSAAFSKEKTSDGFSQLPRTIEAYEALMESDNTKRLRK